MENRTRVVLLIAFAVCVAMGPATRRAFAQDQNATSSDQKQQLADADVKRLLALMDTDKNGRISKHECMGFMSQEFDRLDTDKSGELDVHELAHSRLQASTFSSVGK